VKARPRLQRVVFPQPFGPISPTISPGSTCSDTSRIAQVSSTLSTCRSTRVNIASLIRAGRS
jgi:hypothetical protein